MLCMCQPGSAELGPDKAWNEAMERPWGEGGAPPSPSWLRSAERACKAAPAHLGHVLRAPEMLWSGSKPSRADFPHTVCGMELLGSGNDPSGAGRDRETHSATSPVHRQGSEAASASPGSWDVLKTMGSMPEAPVEAEFQLQPAIPAHGFVKPGVHSRLI